MVVSNAARGHVYLLPCLCCLVDVSQCVGRHHGLMICLQIFILDDDLAHKSDKTICEYNVFWSIKEELRTVLSKFTGIAAGRFGVRIPVGVSFLAHQCRLTLGVPNLLYSGYRFFSGAWF